MFAPNKQQTQSRRQINICANEYLFAIIDRRAKIENVLRNDFYMSGSSEDGDRLPVTSTLIHFVDMNRLNGNNGRAIVNNVYLLMTFRDVRDVEHLGTKCTHARAKEKCQFEMCSRYGVLKILSNLIYFSFRRWHDDSYRYKPFTFRFAVVLDFVPFSLKIYRACNCRVGSICLSWSRDVNNIY